MRKDNLPPEVHRVKTRLADGSFMYYFSLRGRKGTGFYRSPDRLPREREFLAAYVSALDAAAPKKSGFSTFDLVDDYLSSPRYQRLKQRTKDDYRLWLGRFTSEFGDDPAAMFEEWESKVEVNEWRDNWKSSPKQFDYAGTVVTMLLNWAAGKGRIRRHHCSFEKVYKADRAHITWTQEFIDTFLKNAPESIGRVLVAATETGLRPADLVKLRRFDVQNLNSGNRRLRIATNKRGVYAHIQLRRRWSKSLIRCRKGRNICW